MYLHISNLLFIGIACVLSSRCFHNNQGCNHEYFLSNIHILDYVYLSSFHPNGINSIRRYFLLTFWVPFISYLTEMKELMVEKFTIDYIFEKLAPRFISKCIPGDRDYIHGGENNDYLLFRLLYLQGDGNNCTCIFQTAENCYQSSHLTVNCEASIWFCPIVRKKK